MNDTFSVGVFLIFGLAIIIMETFSLRSPPTCLNL